VASACGRGPAGQRLGDQIDGIDVVVGCFGGDEGVVGCCAADFDGIAAPAVDAAMHSVAAMRVHFVRA